MCWSSAPASPVRSARAAWPRSSSCACWSSTAARTSPATPTTPLDEHGVLIHTYGPHIFHTNAAEGDRLPVALHRVAALRAPGVGRGRRADRPDADQPHDCPDAPRRRARRRGRRPRRTSTSLAEPRAELKTSEDAVVAKVGRDLYERLFRGYTRKQWALDPSELHASVCARTPGAHQRPTTATSPTPSSTCRAAGFTAMFERMLDHPNIEVASRDRVRATSAHEVDAAPARVDRADRRVLRLPAGKASLPEPPVRARDARHPGRPARPAGRGRSTTPTSGSRTRA